MIKQITNTILDKIIFKDNKDAILQFMLLFYLS